MELNLSPEDISAFVFLVTNTNEIFLSLYILNKIVAEDIHVGQYDQHNTLILEIELSFEFSENQIDKLIQVTIGLLDEGLGEDFEIDDSLFQLGAEVEVL